MSLFTKCSHLEHLLPVNDLQKVILKESVPSRLTPELVSDGQWNITLGIDLLEVYLPAKNPPKTKKIFLHSH
jgi:hypothetical protein